ncbi:MAG: VOC family protein, partial [Epsilonproteobacteria bacterium]
MQKLKLLVSIGLVSMLFTGCTSMKGPVTQQERLSSLTAITENPTGEYHPGKFVWHDLITDDVSAAKRFYADVFGWSFEKHGAYTLVSNQGKPVGGMLEIKPQAKSKAEAVWVPSLSVADVDRSLEYVKSQKGKVLKGPFDIPDRGRGVLVSDPHGAHLVLLHAKGGDPKDTIPQIGDWLWNELWTNVPKESYSFYRKLGTYDASEVRDSYRIFKKKGK